MTSTRPSSFNLLLVVARNLDADNPEVEPAVELASLAALFQEIDSRAVVWLSHCIGGGPPGYICCFPETLATFDTKHGWEYFHLVHFDMHGVVAKRSIRGTTEEAMPGYIILQT